MINGRVNLNLVTESTDRTISLGKELAGILRNHDVVVLSGPLGAGKTCFIKGIALGLGISEDNIKSPSFTLINEYYGTLPLYHFDLYRMKESLELHQIGWDDYLLRDGIVVVEWGEKAENQLPENRIEVLIDISSETRRNLRITFVE